MKALFSGADKLSDEMALMALYTFSGLAVTSALARAFDASCGRWERLRGADRSCDGGGRRSTPEKRFLGARRGVQIWGVSSQP